MKIIPTIFAKTKKQFNKRLKKLLELNRDLHIDFMDGKFVKAKGVAIKKISNLKKYNISFQAHLMCLEPASYVKDLKNKGFREIIFHYEAVKDKDKILGLILYIHHFGMKAILAVNPETKLDRLKNFLNYADGVLVMGVHPGRENQKFISRLYDKIRNLRKMDREIKIQVDGGINLKTAKKLKKAGADILNSGSFISDAEDSHNALKELENAFG